MLVVTQIGLLLERPVTLLIFLGFSGLFGLTIVAGVLLWKDHSLGAQLSLVAQAVQIPHIATNVFSYMMVAGIRIVPTLLRVVA